MHSQILDVLNRLTLWIAGFAILAMSIIGGLDAIGTAILTKPIPGAYEATETLMVFTVFLALGRLHREGGYIAVDIFYLSMKPAMRRVVDTFALLLMTAYFGLITWRGWINALRSWELGEYSVGLVAFPVYPARFALALGATLAVVCCIADLFGTTRFRREMAEDDASQGR